MKFKVEKIIDEYYSDKTYSLVKLSLKEDSFKDNFKEGDIIEISISKVK